MQSNELEQSSNCSEESTSQPKRRKIGTEISETAEEDPISLLESRIENVERICQELSKNVRKREESEPNCAKPPCSREDESEWTASPDEMTKRETKKQCNKHFVLKDEFKNVLALKNEEERSGTQEQHFGNSWGLQYKRHGDHFALGLWGLWAKAVTNAEESSIEVHIVMKILSKKNQHSMREYFETLKFGNFKIPTIYKTFMEWEELKTNFIVDDKLMVEVYVGIVKMVGVRERKLKSFEDDTMKKRSDVVFIVDKQKFYLSKHYLSYHSSYFKNLLSEKCQESEIPEIELIDVDADDFQKYLEVLYHEESINDFTVERILLVATKYETSSVIKDCKEYLMGDRERTSTETKIHLCQRYNFTNYEAKILSLK